MNQFPQWNQSQRFGSLGLYLGCEEEPDCITYMLYLEGCKLFESVRITLNVSRSVAFIWFALLGGKPILLKGNL